MGSATSAHVGHYYDVNDNRSPQCRKGTQAAVRGDGENKEDTPKRSVSSESQTYVAPPPPPPAVAPPNNLNTATSAIPFLPPTVIPQPALATTTVPDDSITKEDGEVEYSFHFYDSSGVQGEQENLSPNSNIRRHRASLNTQTVQKQKDTGHAYYYEAEQSNNNNNNNTSGELNSMSAYESSNLERSGRASQTDMNSFMNTSQLDVNNW